MSEGYLHRYFDRDEEKAIQEGLLEISGELQKLMNKYQAQDDETLLVAAMYSYADAANDAVGQSGRFLIQGFRQRIQSVRLQIPHKG